MHSKKKMLYILSIPLDLLGSALLMQPQSWWGSGPTPPHQHAAEELWALGDCIGKAALRGMKEDFATNRLTFL